MSGERGFDEVMIVNPCDPARGVRTMTFNYAEGPEMGYFAETDPYGGFAEQPYLSEDPTFAEDPYGYYAEEPYGYYGEEPPYGYAEDPYGTFAEEPYGYYGEAPYGYYGEDPYGYYAEEPYGYAEDPYGYYAEEPYGYAEDPYGYYAEEPYGETPEMVGWGEPYEQPGMGAYVRDMPPAFNAGCPLPTNVAGFGESPLEGYARPAEVSPSCTQFTAQSGNPIPMPDSFKPHW